MQEWMVLDLALFCTTSLLESKSLLRPLGMWIDAYLFSIRHSRFHANQMQLALPLVWTKKYMSSLTFSFLDSLHGTVIALSCYNFIHSFQSKRAYYDWDMEYIPTKHINGANTYLVSLICRSNSLEWFFSLVSGYLTFDACISQCRIEPHLKVFNFLLLSKVSIYCFSFSNLLLIFEKGAGQCDVVCTH